MKTAFFLHCFNFNLKDWWLSLHEQIKTWNLDSQSIIQYSAIIAGFISITLPIALDMMAKHTEDFKDKEISEIFPNHFLYRFQLFANLTIVFMSILMIALRVEGIWILLILFADGFAIIMFVRFLILIQSYATNFAEIYSNQLKENSDKIVRGE
ncbi:MAG: hypothetical protein HOP08_00540 [Cyclobacteriaceae bacterium]|nr:hypothetical protein [Cyclobacteriaceae bacterium]